MIEEITTIPGLPAVADLDGDYDITQAALLLGSLTDGQLVLQNFNGGRDTAGTVSLLTGMGHRVSLTDDEVRIQRGESLSWDDCAEITFDGGLMPLTMLVGMLAGMNMTCRVRYSPDVNPDLLDELINILNKTGIDIAQPKEQELIIRESCLAPIELCIDSPLPYVKNCLLMIGLCSGCSVTIKEERASSGYLESLIERFGGNLTKRARKTIWREDPHDPRKREKTTDMDCAREIKLGVSSKLHGGIIEIPPDTNECAAMLALAVLARDDLTLQRVSLDRRLSKFMQYVKASGVTPETTNRETVDGRPFADLSISGDRLKGRKISGSTAFALIEQVPLMAVMAATSDGTTIIRDTGGLHDALMRPFEEIIENLTRMDIKCGRLDDGLAIEGGRELNGADFGPFDNRTVALAFYLVALAGKGKSYFDGFELITDHYPKLARMMMELTSQQPAEMGRKP
ncbi:MAG: hypothetical protein JW763_10720 [candidate division Zixibacteria bacterium]|nr:hypothetical protein [candidate division Zixibacteria bacterium]